MPFRAAMVDQMLDHLHARVDRSALELKLCAVKEHACEFNIGVSTLHSPGPPSPSAGGCTL
jgi:hypothetical protein